MDFGPILLFALIVVGVIVYLLSRTKTSSSKRRPTRRYASATLGRQDFATQWQRIEQLMAQPGLESSRSAIFEADKLLDAALRQSGFRGETMGERLKNARSSIENQAVYQGMWDAHKMRNALAHELGFDLPKMVAQEQLDKFLAGLHYLKVM
jgi:hypothetical protein